MGDEYIRKADAVDEINVNADGLEQNGCIPFAQGARAMAIVVEQMPTANVVPVVHGEWIHMGCGVFECDKCGERISTNVYVREEASERFKYCPNGGAKMDGEE